MRQLLILVLLVSGVANAAISFEDNQHFDDRLMLALVRQSGTIEQGITAIDSVYIDDGYFLAKCDLRIEAGDTLLAVNEGRCFRLADLQIVGITDSVAAKVLARYDRSTPLSQLQLERITEGIVRTYADNGHPFAQAEIAELTARDSVLTASYRVIEGPRVAVGLVSFPGLRNTRPGPLRKRIDLRSGALYREDDLLASEATLSQLRHCRPDGVPALTYQGGSGTVDIALPMRDERSLAFDGLAYLNPDNTVSGQANVSLLNSLGRGEELKVFWSRRNEVSSVLNFSVSVPYVADHPIDVSAELLQEDRDSSYVGTSAQTAAAYHVSEKWSVGLGVRWDKITPEENRATAAARVLAVDLSTQFDGRDDIRQTGRGAQLAQHIVKGYRQSFPIGGGVGSGYSTYLNGDLRAWRPLRGKLVVFQRLRYFQITSDFDPIPIDQLIKVGGVESLRGYREDSFLANLGAVSSTELRWYAADNLMLHLFSDNCYIETLGADRRLSGFGAGVAITTTAGTFRFELALGEEKKLNKMLVHLGLEGRL